MRVILIFGLFIILCNTGAASVSTVQGVNSIGIKYKAPIEVKAKKRKKRKAPGQRLKQGKAFLNAVIILLILSGITAFLLWWLAGFNFFLVLGLTFALLWILHAFYRPKIML